MDCTSHRLAYDKTGFFPAIALDYVNREAILRPFYAHEPIRESVTAAIRMKEGFAGEKRKVLVNSLRSQYEGIPMSAASSANLDYLLGNTTFTVTTAHQPHILTGPLFSVYKILHVIRLARELREMHPGNRFVPVFFMGSEDADLEELGRVRIGGNPYIWNTNQRGAMGRMRIDVAFGALIAQLEEQMHDSSNGREIVKIFKDAYVPDKTIQQATLELLNALFGKYGLLVLIPDNRAFKEMFRPVMEMEIREKFSNRLVKETLERLEPNYKIQAQGREINLFYLLGDSRERIEIRDDLFTVPSLGRNWSQEELILEIGNHPERFSPNVILRGLFQETILPNIVFVGGGSELGYWLGLKSVFSAAGTPFPMLLLRNSFLVMDNICQEILDKLGIRPEEVFESEHALMNRIIAGKSANETVLNGELEKIRSIYQDVFERAVRIDKSLGGNVSALQAKAMAGLEELEKKMLRAEKRKYQAESQLIQNLKTSLFPDGKLQERNENIAGFYESFGPGIIEALLDHSPGFEQEFSILRWNDPKSEEDILHQESSQPRSFS
jgi:bacillithiol biosynthesis cysteine-adding enzyme BshC